MCLCFSEKPVTFWCPPPPPACLRILALRGVREIGPEGKAGQGAPHVQAHSSTFTQIKGEVILGAQKMHQWGRCGGKRPFYLPVGEGVGHSRRGCRSKPQACSSPGQLGQGFPQLLSQPGPLQGSWWPGPPQTLSLLLYLPAPV